MGLNSPARNGRSRLIVVEAQCGYGSESFVSGECERHQRAIFCFFQRAQRAEKITYLPAQRFGLTKKGNPKTGMDADLTIFDFKRIRTNSDYVNIADPNEPPDGIEAVVINGHIALRKKQICDNAKNFGKLIKSAPLPYA